MMSLEIACFNVQNAIIAAGAGADRIEFCKNYAIGGKSPSLEDFQLLKDQVSVPIFVMIRTRSGNFIYNESEIEEMQALIREFDKAGADGFVFGVLNEDRTINESACKLLLQSANDKPCTFHRAIDAVKDYETSIELLIELGFKAVLSSGKNCTAELGLANLKHIQEKFGKQITVIAGGGVRASNFDLLVTSHCKVFHSAALDEEQKISIKEIEQLKNKILTYEKN
jgi:copper homeostasis protein